MKNTSGAIKFTLILLLSLLIFLSSTAVSFSSEKSVLNVVLLIDKSGSMASNDAPRARCEAAKLFVRLCSDNDRVSVVEFGGKKNKEADDAKVIFRLRRCTGANQNELCDAIDKITQNDDYTSMHSGLEKAHEILTEEEIGDNEVPIIILLTDGQMREGKDLRPGVKRSYVDEKIKAVTDSCAEKNIRIMTVGLRGAQKDSENIVDIDFLKSLAEKTDGKHRDANGPNFLIGLYRDIFIDITHRYYACFNSPATKNIAFNYAVNFGEKNLYVLVARKDKGTFSSDLIDKFSVIPENTLQHPKFEIFRSPFYNLIKVDTGKEFWKKKIKFDITLKEVCEFELFFFKELKIDMNITSPTPEMEFYTGKPVPLSLVASLTDGNEPMSEGITAKAEVIGPDQNGQSETINLSFTNNNIFASQFIPRLPGNYKINFSSTLPEVIVSDAGKSDFTCSKSLVIKVKMLPRASIFLQEPVDRSFHVLNSNIDIVAKLTPSTPGVNVSAISLKALVTAGGKTAKIDMTSGFGGDKSSYHCQLKAEREGDVIISLEAATSENCEFDYSPLKSEISIVNEPALNIKSPVNGKIFENKNIEVHGSVNFGGNGNLSSNNLKLTAELVNLTDNNSSKPIDLKQESSSGEVKFTCSIDPADGGDFKVKVSAFVTGIDSAGKSKTLSDERDFSYFEPVRPELFLYNDQTSETRSVPDSFFSDCKPFKFRVEAKDIGAVHAKMFDFKITAKMNQPNGKVKICPLVKINDKEYAGESGLVDQLGPYSVSAVADFVHKKSGQVIACDIPAKKILLAYKVIGVKIDDSEAAMSEMGDGTTNLVYSAGELQTYSGCSDSPGCMTFEVKLYKGFHSKFSGNSWSVQPANLDGSLKVAKLESGSFIPEGASEPVFELPLEFSVVRPSASEEIQLFNYGMTLEEDGNKFDLKIPVYISATTTVPPDISYVLLPLVLIIAAIAVYIYIRRQNFDFDLAIIRDGTQLLILKRSSCRKYTRLKWKKMKPFKCFVFNVDARAVNGSDVLKFERTPSHFYIWCSKPGSNKWSVRTTTHGNLIKKVAFINAAGTVMTPNLNVENGSKIVIDNVEIKFIR